MYQYQQQQQQALPWAPNQIQHQYLNLSLNNPPYIPSIPCDPFVAPYLPLVAAITACEIQQNSQKNPLRTFMFNQCSSNAFVNQYFEAIIGATLDYIGLQMSKRAYPNIEIAIQELAPKVVEMFCALNLREFPALESYVDPQSFQAAQATIAFFDSLANEMRYWKRQQETQQRGPAAPQYAPGQTGYRPGWVQQAQAQPAPNLVSRYAGTGGGTSLFNRGAEVSGSKAEGLNIANRWKDTSPLTQPYTRRDQPMPQREVITTAQGAPVAEKAEHLLASGNFLLWRPSEKYPHPPAYNPYQCELYFRKEADGTITPELKKRDDVDYDRHKIVTVFGPLPKGLTKIDENALQRLQHGTNEMAREDESQNEELPEGQKPAPRIYVRDKITAETSEKAAWFDGAVDRLTAENGQVPDVYRVYARIAEPVISFVDETGVVCRFGDSSTYIELREKMNAAIDDVSSELWSLCNLKMTALINRVLAQNLSLPGLEIQSFVTDIEETIAYLGEKYGTNVQEAFLRHQKDNIKASFQVMYEDAAEQLTATLLDGRQYPEDRTPKITYLSSDYTLTYLNCLAHELELELSIGVGAAVSPNLTPVMHLLLETLFKASDVTDHRFDRHLLRTNDGRIMEATRGYLGKDFYLLTLVK